MTNLTKCKKCEDVYLTNPRSKMKGVCRECENDVGVGKVGKGFSYQWPSVVRSAGSMLIELKFLIIRQRVIGA